MSSLLLAALLLQAGDEPPPPPPLRAGFDAGPAFLKLDSALGADRDIATGFEAGFRMSLKPEPRYTIGLRLYYRRWEVDFDEFQQLSADLDGDVEQLGLDLVVTYPVTGPLSIGVEFGGGALRIEHDEDDDLAAFFGGGGFLRLDLPAGFYIEAGAGAFGAFTEFGGQEEDSDHVSWTGRLDFGLQIEF